jgi:hypothetical protein
MNLEELSKLVDKGRNIKEKIDALELELVGVKKTLSKEAKTRKVGYFLGKKHFARVSPHSITECDPEKLEETLAGMDMADEFYECIKVKVTETKKLMGETVFASISETKSEAYKKVSFLKAIPKKYQE